MHDVRIVSRFFRTVSLAQVKTLRSSAHPRPLINIGIGNLKGVADQFQARRLAFQHQHFHHIESKQNVRIVEQPQPGQTAERNPLLLCAPNRFDRPAEILARPRLHFHEDERVVVATNKIDLAAPAATEVAVKNLVAMLAQKTAGQLFTARAESEVFRFSWLARKKKAAAPPARTTGDGWGRVRIHGVSSGAIPCRNLCAG